MLRGASRDDDEEDQRAHDLREHRAPRRAGDARVEAVDEQHLEREVEHVRADRDDKVVRVSWMPRR